MSKSALIIDTPATCADCDLMGGCIANKYTCNGLGRMIIGNYDKGRFEDCPLRELPKTKHPILEIYGMGWNDCLNAVTGGEE